MLLQLPAPSLPSPLLILAWPLALAIAGCMASHRGLVESTADETLLHTAEGRSYKLALGAEGASLSALGGCAVEVEGVRLADRLVVRDWTVVDGGDGSVPYVGPLVQHGSNLLLEDRGSGMPLLLDPSSASKLAPHAGRLLMVTGYVVGTQELHVVEFRVLSE